MVSRREILSVPSLDGRVMPAGEFGRRWKAMDREERQWLREAGFRARRVAEPELRPLVAAFAWRELSRAPWYAAGIVGFGILWYFAFALLAGPAGSAGALIPASVVAASYPIHARRLAAALALNIGPPPTVADG